MSYPWTWQHAHVGDWYQCSWYRLSDIMGKRHQMGWVHSVMMIHRNLKKSACDLDSLGRLAAGRPYSVLIRDPIWALFVRHPKRWWWPNPKTELQMGCHLGPGAGRSALYRYNSIRHHMPPSTDRRGKDYGSSLRWLQTKFRIVWWAHKRLTVVQTQDSIPNGTPTWVGEGAVGPLHSPTDPSAVTSNCTVNIIY